MENHQDTIEATEGDLEGIVEMTQNLSNDVEMAQNVSNDVEKAQNVSNDVEMAQNVSNDVETAQNLSNDVEKAQNVSNDVERSALRGYYISHIQGLERQAAAMQAVFPGFDLRRELGNPMFARLTAPDVGLSVEDAYYTVHRRSLQSAAMQVTAQRTARRITEAIRSGMRPVESGGGTPAVGVQDYRSMSPQERAALKARIRAGEKIFP